MLKTEQTKREIQNNFYDLYSFYQCKDIKESPENKLIIDTNVLSNGYDLDKNVNSVIVKAALLDNCSILFNYDMFIEYFQCLFNSNNKIKKKNSVSFLSKLIDKGIPILSTNSSVILSDLKKSFFYDAYYTSKTSMSYLGLKDDDILLVTNNKNDYPMDSHIISPRDYIYYY